MLHPIFHNTELDRDTSSHLDSTTEGDLAIALREVQITHGELGAFDMDWQVDLRPTGQVLDITVAAVLRSTWNGTGTLFANLVLDIVSTATDVNALWVWWQSNIATHVATFLDELAFTIVPCLQYFG